ESWGVRPGFVAGHSVGELAAAYVAGVWSLEDACRVVAARARLMEALPEGGAMAAVQATAAEITTFLADGVVIASVNGPRQVVISGPGEAVDRVMAEAAAQGYRARRLDVSHAFHSPLVEPMLEEFRQVLDTVAFHAPTLAAVSNVTGTWADPQAWCSPEYWVRQVREPVLFADNVTTLLDAGVSTWIELGPSGALTAMVAECATDDTTLRTSPTLRPGHDDVRTTLTAMATLHTAGHPVDWAPLFPHANTVDLPTYAFQHQHYWLERTTPAPATSSSPTPLDDWTYRIDWTPLTGDATAPPLSGTWLLIRPTGDHPLAADVERFLTRHGATVIGIGATDPLEYDGVTGVVSLLGLSGDADGGLRATLRVVQDMISAAAGIPLWILTSGAVSVGGTDPVSAPEQGTLWGFARAAAAEHPELGVVRIDLPDRLTDHTGARLCARLSARDEQEIAIRPAGVFARRLVRTRLVPEESTAGTWSPRGTVLITGGTGALAGHVAHWLADNGAEHIVLAGRRGPDSTEARALHEELLAAGVKATVVRCDVTDREAVRELLADHRPHAVVHTAAVLDDATVASLTTTQLDRVLRPKLLGATHLHELTQDMDMDLDAFVLFSSLAGVLGGAGQANYAAANAFLDALAAHRVAQGLPAASLAWGPWAGDGMAGTRIVEERLRRTGVAPLAPEHAVQALGRARGPVVVADVDWARLAKGARHRLLDALPETREAARPARDERPDFSGDLAARTPEEQSAMLLEAVRAEIAAVLRYDDPARIGAASEFLELGFDSLTSIELRNRLGIVTGLALPAMLTLEHRTPAALAEYLRDRMAAAGTSSSSVALPVPSALPASDTSGSLDELWREADRHGRRLEFIDLLTTAAGFRPAYDDPAGLDLPPLRLTSGGTDTPVFCIPSHLGKADPHKFVPFGTALRGRRDVYVLREPGFVTGQPIPATLDVLLATHARALEAHDSFVLLGYSAGGLAAHALAAHLAERGRPPAAVVLVDTYAPEQAEVMTRIQGAMEQGQRERDGRTGGSLGEAWLTAMGRYFSFDWTPRPVDVPVLHVRAGDPMAGMPADLRWQARWNLPHTGTDVPGDHFTMMEHHAPRTADVVHDWLATAVHRP
ncbi:type I polyketide synthase, partial [Streptomyces sp. L500]